MSEITKRTKSCEFAKIAKIEDCESANIPIRYIRFRSLAAGMSVLYVLENRKTGELWVIFLAGFALGESGACVLVNQCREAWRYPYDGFGYRFSSAYKGP
jgi:hypothetical protein